MKVRIVKARDNQLWYSDMVGTEWEVTRKETISKTGEDYYILKNKRFVFVSDCEIHEKLPDELFEL